MTQFKIVIVILLGLMIFGIGCDASVINLQIQPNSYDFGKVNIGSTLGYIFRIYNNSPDSTLIRSLDLIGVNTTDFYISEGNISNLTLAPGKKHVVKVMFSPKAENKRTVNLKIHSNAREQYTWVPLIGYGQKVARINIPETTYDFGNVYTNLPVEHTFDVYNTGTSQLTLTNFKFIGIGASYYSVTNAIPTPLIQAQDIGSLTVKCLPTLAGSFPAILEISHNGANDNPFRLNLTCTAISSDPKLSLSKNNPWVFDDTFIGKDSEENILLRSDGYFDLKIDSVALQSGTEFSITAIKNINNTPVNFPVQLVTGKYIIVSVKFSPNSNGLKTDKLVIQHNGANYSSPYMHEIQGTGKILHVEKFTTPGNLTWTVPAGIKTIKVLAIGGGGGGSGSHYGGGGSGWVVVKDVIVTPGSNISITVGAGGAGGISGTNSSAGDDGKDTEFGILVKASGGKGGGGANVSYTTGGDGGSGGGGAGNSGFGGKGGSAGSKGDPGASFDGGQGGHFDSLTDFIGVLTAGDGGAAGTSSNAGGGGAGGVLLNGIGPDGGDGGDTWSGKGGKGYGAGGGSGGFSSTTGTRPGGGAGADGMIYIEY